MTMWSGSPLPNAVPAATLQCKLRLFRGRLARAWRRAMPQLVWRGQEVDVRIVFREAKLNPHDPIGSLLEGHLAQVERALGEIGIEFDKGVGASGRDWDLDWSLRGPISVTFVSRAQKPERRRA